MVGLMDGVMGCSEPQGLQGNHYTPWRSLVSITCHIECREVRLDVSVLAGMLAPLQFITLLSAT